MQIILVLVQALTVLMTSFQARASTTEMRKHACRSAFGALLDIHAARERSLYFDIADRDLSILVKWAKAVEASPELAFERFETFRRLDTEMALALNDREIIRMVTLTTSLPFANVEETLKTMLVKVRVRSGERAIKVPHRIHARLTALAILTKTPASEVAATYNQNFSRVVSEESRFKGRSELANIIFEAPVDTALRMTIHESEAAPTKAGFILQD